MLFAKCGHARDRQNFLANISAKVTTSTLGAVAVRLERGLSSICEAQSTGSWGGQAAPGARDYIECFIIPFFIIICLRIIILLRIE